MKRTGLRSRPKRKPSTERVLARDFRAAVLAKGPCLMCCARATDPHHVVYQQHLRADHHPLWDPRDGIPLCRPCHEAHHNQSKPVPLSFLGRENLEFAFECLGDYAHDYLMRRYGGTDELLNELAKQHRSAA